jgi:tetraacyldisaccharide 4'-kinase
LKSTLQKAWRKRGLLACALWPVSQLYGLLITIRSWFFKRGVLTAQRVRVPVIVVGNVTAGGGGKTPLVMALVAHFAGRGAQPGVVSRGYGRRGSACLEVLPDTPILESGDEPAHIKRALAAPVFIANNRVEACRALLAAHPQTDVIICDDGLQHERLQRTVNVVVFDDSGLGNGWLIPAGPLRQRWPMAAQTTKALVLHTGSKPAFAGFTSSRQLADAAIACDGSAVPLQTLIAPPAGQGALIALAGIAHPDAFFAMLSGCGLPLLRTVGMADHADFSSFDLASLKLPNEANITVLCTEKDAIKLFDLPQNPSVRILAVPLVFTPEAAFFAALDRAVNLDRS